MPTRLARRGPTLPAPARSQKPSAAGRTSAGSVGWFICLSNSAPRKSEAAKSPGHGLCPTAPTRQCQLPKNSVQQSSPFNNQGFPRSAKGLHSKTVRNAPPSPDGRTGLLEQFAGQALNDLAVHFALVSGHDRLH